ncbi:OmpP1/FadL family transporter [Flavicella sediminum]|uniref:OmpP1/FadL family transporter n=1 Tax=Flavicella sediminum TaxID=2585141 RepID=UPI00111DEC2C|nr:hemin receptor [Flavicella sediminum]
MKKIFFLFLAICYAQNAISQSLSYEDLGKLASQNNFQGSARFNAMAGAFGALGGDISATFTNPASGAVFSHSEFSGSLSVNTIKTNAAYYGTTTYSENTKANVPQVGAVFIFENANRSPWHKFAIGFNYSILNNFNNNYTVTGNNTNKYATFINHPFDGRDPISDYTIAEEQNFTNDTNGNAEVFTFSFSSAYEDILYLGASLNSHQLSFTQNTFLSEINNDGNGNTLFADYSQYQSQISNGISLGVGLIAKLSPNARFGLAYQSPIWYYDTTEETNILEADGFDGSTQIEATDINRNYSNSNYYALSSFNYAIKTPSKFTFSGAYVFEQNGLISIDYSLSNYKKIHLSENRNSTGFLNDNKNFKSDLNDNSATLRLGTEWRLKQWSFRGGYFMEDSIYEENADEIVNKGYSFGFGITLKNTKLDLSYQNSKYLSAYDFYGDYDEIDAANLDFDTSQITATLSFTL